MAVQDFTAPEAVLILAGGFEEMEAVMTLDTLRRGGVFVISVSITGQTAVTGSHGITVFADALFEDVDFTASNALVLPGGQGSENYYKHSGLVSLVNKYNADTKLIAAVCAAPAFLAWAGILNGKRAAVFPGAERKIGEAGVGVAWSAETVLRDGHIITGRGPGYSAEFALLIVATLKGEAAAEEARLRIYP